MYNIRYHIASLVAVFLALAVGLLLGSIVVERGLLNAQRTTLVSGLQAEFDKLRAEAATQKLRNDALEAFAAEASPALMDGLLDGRTILIIADPDSMETVTRATEAIRAAGGVPAVAAFTSAGLSLEKQQVIEAAATALGVPAASVAETTVIDALSREWSTPGDPRILTSALVSARGLEFRGLAATATVGGVVVSAVYAGDPDPAALSLARAFTGLGRFAAGVETTKRSTGIAKAAVDTGMSGVDDVDTPLGRLSLAWILAGRSSGSFGVGEEAQSAYPTPLFVNP